MAEELRIIDGKNGLSYFMASDREELGREDHDKSPLKLPGKSSSP